MTFNVGLLGFGTVGTGVARILLDPQDRHPLLKQIAIRRVGVRSLTKPRQVELPPECFTDNLEAIVTDPEIDIVIEVMGGVETAKSLILKAIAHGKHIVTANKAVLARHGDEIFTTAKAMGVYIMLEAAVCGGIPIIAALKQSMGGNRIISVTGIINGTTNYILSRMQQAGEDFAAILVDAQALGYAEADPSADVDGFDATDKIAILASLAFGDRIRIQEIYREGIRAITQRDVTLVGELGYVIKLLGIARRNDRGLDVRVHPALVIADDPLAGIHGVTNAVRIVGEPLGEVVFAGPGAGSGATASAVVADLTNVVAALNTNPDRVNTLMGCTHQRYATLVPIADTESQFYVRLHAREQPGVIGELGTCFGKHRVSIQAIVQKGSDRSLAEVAIVTQRVLERDFQSAIAEIRELPAIDSIPTIIRVW